MGNGAIGWIAIISAICPELPDRRVDLIKQRPNL
jgi:hypothetical protein